MMRLVSDPVLDVTTRLISKLGRRSFPGEVLSAYRQLAGCDFCAAFDVMDREGPRVIFAQGDHPRIPHFAMDASEAYARRYWRMDANMCGDLARWSGSGIALMRTTPGEINDPDYRRDCYDRAGIIERFALVDCENSSLVITGYRAAERGLATAMERERIMAAAPGLLAAMRRHCELVAKDVSEKRAECRSAMFEKAKAFGLSDREGYVAVALADGEGQTEIAENSGLAFSSVVTYRKRAYRKLQVENRRTLRAFFELQRNEWPSD